MTTKAELDLALREFRRAKNRLSRMFVDYMRSRTPEDVLGRTCPYCRAGTLAHYDYVRGDTGLLRCTDCGALFGRYAPKAVLALWEDDHGCDPNG